MRSKPPLYLQHAWRLYHCTEALLSCLWDTYDHEFLEHYFPEIAGDPPEPPMEAYCEGLDDDDDIPF